MLTSFCSGQLKSCCSNGGSPSTDFPCDPAANVSTCCGGGSYCVTNFYCIDAEGDWVVGTCTDDMWQDPACPLQLEYGFGGFNFTLNTTDCGDGTYYPNVDNQTCRYNQQGIQEIDYRGNQPLPTMAAFLSSYYSANDYTIPTSTGSAASDSGSSTTQASASMSSSAHVTPTSSSQPPAAPSTAPSSLSTSEQSGIAVGTLAGFCALCGLLYLFFGQQKPNKAAQEIPNLGALNGAEALPGYEEAELMGEPARSEMDSIPRVNELHS